jgi:hypothetical protein
MNNHQFLSHWENPNSGHGRIREIDTTGLECKFQNNQENKQEE